MGRFRVLGVDLSLEGPERVVASIGAAYARFKIPANTPGRSIRVAVPPASASLGDAALYQRFLATLLSHVERHAVFHGAALIDRGGGGLIVAGPSGHGKSSLALELVRRGLRFLGDDYAPVDLETGTVWPFPRTASVAAGAAAPLPESVRRLASAPDTPRLFGKALVDVGRAFGPDAMAVAAAPIHTVAILAPPGASPSATVDLSWMTLAVRAAEADRLAVALRAIPGVALEEETEGSDQRRWRLRIEHAHAPTEALSSIVEDEAVLFSERTWSEAPDFGANPGISPLKRREAAVFLTRELLNRRRGSRFLEGRPGGVPGLVLDVAHALRNASCWQLRVGRFRETADLLESLTERRST